MARGSAHAADERSKTGSYVLNWAAACAVGPGGVRIFILTSGRDPRWVARAERSTYRNVRFRLLVACQVGEFVPLRARWRPLANVLEVDSRRLTAVTEVGFHNTFSTHPQAHAPEETLALCHESLNNCQRACLSLQDKRERRIAADVLHC